MKITGEYKQCPDCDRPFQRRYPPRTPMTVGRRDGRVEITPHYDDCRWVPDGE